jgi:hypothetical protein
MGSLGLLILLLGGLLYFLPAIIGRHKRDHTSILLLNLFLGWTLIGWVIALIWAVSQDAPAPVYIAPFATLPAVLFCPTCGNGLGPQDVFCRNCGKRIRNPAA